MEIRNRKNIIIIHIFCVLVLSVLLSGCVERIHLKETAKTSREKRTLEFVDGTWNGDFLEKAKQLLQKRIMESGEGNYNVVIEDFDSDNSSANASAGTTIAQLSDFQITESRPRFYSFELKDSEGNKETFYLHQNSVSKEAS